MPEDPVLPEVPVVPEEPEVPDDPIAPDSSTMLSVGPLTSPNWKVPAIPLTVLIEYV